MEVQLAETLYCLGHDGNACSVGAVAELFSLSVGAVAKSTRRVVGTLAAVAPEHVRWPNAGRREELSDAAAGKYGFQCCFGAADGTTFPLAYQPASHPWAHYDRKQRYMVSTVW